LQSEHGIYGPVTSFEWEADDDLMVIDVKLPGGYRLVEADIAAQSVIFERKDYGAIAVLNDLHMGCYSGDLWRWFIDFSAILLLVFTLSGLWLVFPQKKKRKKLLLLSVFGSVLMGGTYVGAIML
ncbi:MAG: PepSY-associated TM helix domain-containing protein, partial [Pontibacterium sp.]